MMKNYIYSILLGITLVTVSCKHNNLDDVGLIKNNAVSISGDGVVVAGVTKDNETVKVPFKISLSAAATKAFQVGITLNSDTVNQLIANGTLKNTVVLPNGAIDYPSVINVSYGADTATGVATVRLTTLEANYGKDVAFAFKLTDPGKGNVVKASKSNIMVVLNTKQLIAEKDIHYLSIVNGGTIMSVDYKKNYTTSPAGITIPLIVNLSGQAGTAFNVHVKLNTDTINKLVSSKVLPANAINLSPANFTIDTLIRVNSNSNTAQIRLQIGWPVFDANIVANKKFAFAISLSAPTRHILHPTSSKIIVLVEPTVNLDNNSYITGNGTGLKAEYFSNNQQLDFDGRAPSLVRIDETIDFGGDWLPSSIVSNDNYSSRWTGEFLAPVRGEYIFYQTRWDDGARLFIDGKAVIDDFTTQWDLPSRFAKVTLERGKRYKIEADHRENVGGQQARLEYEVPSAGINGRRIVPKSQLFPAQ